ncbi:MAG TPA: IS1380 family transposase [Candidatus Acidoferrum sp.]|nr:IS1380 family transposase [Candidatus Acidoferrum sp.]
MRKGEKVSPTESPLLFEMDPEPAPEILTALGGVPLVVQAFRSLGLPTSVKRHVHVKERERGYDEATLVESFVVLNAAGGECLDDFTRLREDPGLAELIGHPIPSPEAARHFLYQFHEEKNITAAKAQRELGQIAYIPGENQALQGLGQVNRDLITALGQRCPDQRIATVDQDSTIIESRKREALPTYEGERGYQPMLAVWAEMDLVLADQFRDGNVPAMMAPLPVTQVAFAALPATVKTFYFRGDSACHEYELINWLRDEGREGGPPGSIGFAISARMSEALHAAILALPEAAWQAEKKDAEDAEVRRDYAEVPFVPGERREKKDLQPLRYVAVRVRKRQGELFGDGSAVKHFAVVSNLWEWSPVKLMEWHREKAGTIEKVNDVIKNDLGAGVLPCGRFGANAAWLRLAILTHNVLTALKRLALPAELLVARPKRLRFLIFNTPGRVIHHARQILLRWAATKERIAEWIEAMRLLPVPLRV